MVRSFISYFDFFPGSVDGKKDRCGKCTSTWIVLILVCLIVWVILLWFIDIYWFWYCHFNDFQKPYGMFDSKKADIFYLSMIGFIHNFNNVVIFDNFSLYGFVLSLLKQTFCG